MVPEDKAVVAEDVGAAGDAPAQAMVKTQRPRIAYRMCCLPGGTFWDPRLIKWLPTLRVVMFLNPYRRSREATTLIVDELFLR